METVTINVEQYTPDTVLPVEEEWREAYVAAVESGRDIAKASNVVIVGMARSIGAMLPHTIRRLEAIGACFHEWRAVIVENDSEDNTKDLLREWADTRPGQVIADCRDLGREHLHGFERARVERYAEYRNRYREIAADQWPDAQFVLAVDLDPWGGYSLDGVMSSVHWLFTWPHASAMASTSLYAAQTTDGDHVWAHYDQWAFRAWSFKPRWDRYFLQWLPPPGADPIRVKSAFGACCLYGAFEFYNAHYESIEGDIEHVGLHRSMDGDVYLNPASRVVMHWFP